MSELKLAKCTIYYDSWQMQCCGEPFSVGDKIEWTCAIPDERNAHGIKLDFHEEHHGDETHSISGTVKRIMAEYSEDTRYDVPVVCEGDEVLRENVSYADGRETERGDDDVILRHFWGYIVELEDVKIKEI